MDSGKPTSVWPDVVAGGRLAWEEKGACANSPYFLLSIPVDVKCF